MKSKEFTPEEWLRRAKGNFEKVKLLKGKKNIIREDVCHDAQQVNEKSLKGILIYLSGDYVRTHSIRELIVLIEKYYLKFSEELKQAITLSKYASETRYPGDYDEITKEDVKIAFQISKKIVKLEEKIIHSEKKLFK